MNNQKTQIFKWFKKRKLHRKINFNSFYKQMKNEYSNKNNLDFKLKCWKQINRLAIYVRGL